MTPKQYMTTYFALILALVSTTAWSQNTSASTKTSITTTDNGKEIYRWNSSGPLSDFKIEMRGKVELTDDDKDIKSISEDGYLEISKTVFGSKRSILIESLGDGRVKKEYYEGRTKMPWEPNGKKWLGEILPEVVRSSTIGAASRVARFFNKGGTPAVLSEIDKIESDHVKAHYANLLMKYPVAAKDYPSIINSMADMGSDHYLSEFLRNNASKFMQHSESTAALFRATGEMDSDHYKTLVISGALNNKQVSLDNLKLALQAASKMESDHYITEVLNNLLKQNNINDATIAEIIQTTQSLESDHYRTVVLTNALDKPGLSDASHSRLVESVKEMSSDHYITEVVQHLMENKISDPALSSFMDILSSIESDHYRTVILKSILDRQDLTEAQFAKAMAATGEMESDHYKMETLMEAISHATSPARIIQVLNATKEMDSDHYITEVLVSAAPRVKSGSAELKDAYRTSAKNISSETYYGRALRALD